jgi:hypothetical protein
VAGISESHFTQDHGRCGAGHDAAARNGRPLKPWPYSSRAVDGSAANSLSPTGHHGRWGAGHAADAERGTPPGPERGDRRGRNGATAEASRIGFNRCRGIGRRFDVADRNHGRCGPSDATGGRNERPLSVLPTGTAAAADRACHRSPERGDCGGDGRTGSRAADGSADDRVPSTGTTAGAERGTPPESRSGATTEAIGRIVQELPTDRPAIGVAERDRK